MDARATEASSSLSGRRLARNVAWNFGGEVGRALAGLIGTPILLYALGAPKFGLLVLLWAAVALFGLLDGGMSVTITKLAAERIGKERGEEVPDLVWTALLTVISFGVLGGLALWATSSWLITWFNLPSGLGAEAFGSLRLLAIGMPITISLGVFVGVFAAFQRFDLVALTRGPGELLSYVPMFAVLPFSRNVVPLVAVMLIGHAVRLLACLYLMFRIIPGMSDGRKFRFTTLQELFRFSGWIVLVNAIGTAVTSCDRFFIGALISIDAVAFYGPALTLARKVRMVPYLVSGVMMPAFSQGLATDREKTQRLFEHSEKVVLLLVFPISLIAVVFAKPLMTLWLGSAIGPHSAPILQWLIIGTFVSCIAAMPASMLLASNRPDLDAKWLAWTSLPVLGMMWFLTKFCGVDGAAVARAVAMSAGGIFLFAALCRVDSALTRVVRGYAWLVVLSVIALACGALPMGLLGHGLYTASILAVFLVHSWFWMFSRDERKFMIGVLKLSPLSGAA